MMNKLVKNIACLVSILIITIPITMAGGGGAGVEAHLWLNDVNEFPDSETGYIVETPEFDLFISNEDTEAAITSEVIISIPNIPAGSPLPTHVITITQGSITKTIPSSDFPWLYGSPTATKTNGDTYTMPPSDDFPTYYARVPMGEIGAKGSGSDVINAHVSIVGSPPVRFDAWGFNSDGKIILKNPFSHSLTYVPEFPTIALPIAAVIGLVFFFQRKRNKEE